MYEIQNEELIQLNLNFLRHKAGKKVLHKTIQSFYNTRCNVPLQSEASTSGMSGDRPTKRVGRRPGRRSSKMDVRAKLERSRQSARECRARKKLRYQYLEDLVANREKAVFALRDELELVS